MILFKASLSLMKFRRVKLLILFIILVRIHFYCFLREYYLRTCVIKNVCFNLFVRNIFSHNLFSFLYDWIFTYPNFLFLFFKT